MKLFRLYLISGTTWFLGAALAVYAASSVARADIRDPVPGGSGPALLVIGFLFFVALAVGGVVFFRLRRRKRNQI